MAGVVTDNTTYVRRSASAHGRAYTFVVMDNREIGGFTAVASGVRLGHTVTAYDWTPEAVTRKLVARVDAMLALPA